MSAKASHSPFLTASQIYFYQNLTRLTLSLFDYLRAISLQSLVSRPNRNRQTRHYL
jgi:hypothetical protein